MLMCCLQLCVFGHIPDCSYHFVDHNGWPVSPDQENDLDVIDTLQNMCVKIARSSAVASRSQAAIQKTSFRALTLKRSISMEPHAAKRSRSVFIFENLI